MTRLTQRIGLPRYEADEHYKLALAAYQKGNYDLAVSEMDKAIDLLPTQPEYFAARGFVFLQDGVLDKAEVDFKAALDLYGFEMLANYGLGVIAYKDKRWQDALDYFMTAYAVQPQRPEVLYYLALAHHRMRNNAAALDYMRQASAIFEQASDRSRRADANRWVRVLEELLEKTE
jgi:Flp pilus assembly protein TadD